MEDELIFRVMTGRSTPAERARVADWAAGSEENADQLRAVSNVLRLTATADDGLDFGPPPSGEELLGSRGGREPARWTRGQTWQTTLLAVAALAGIALGLPAAYRNWNPGIVETAAGFGADEFTTEAEPATVGLRDGTVIRLAPSTRLRLHENGAEREVSLSGRGYFAVAHDADAPFRVRTDAGAITVLGTRFDLATSGDDLRLIVIEGSVRLAVRGATLEVGAGQFARVVKGNLVPPIDVPDPESLVGWVGDFIVFQDTPLDVAIREIERRHGVRIELTDPRIADQTITALFAGRSFEEIAEVVCLATLLHCTREGDVLKLAPAN